jgi:hypothetical protein
MNRPSISLLLLVLAVVVTTPLMVRAGDLRTGDRVRVNTTNDKGQPAQVIGTVVSLDDDALVVQTGHTAGDPRKNKPAEVQTRTIAMSAVTSVERSMGTEHHTATGALIGAAGGIVVGLLVWEAEKSSDTGTNDFDQALTQTIETATAPAYMLLFGALGTGVGAIIGHASGEEQWGPVDNLSVGVVPAGSGAGTVAVSLNFDF